MSDENATWLIADVGATSSRCAVYGAGRIKGVRVYRNNDWPGLPELLSAYLEGAEARPAGLALAVAAPIDGDEIVMCNRNWTFKTSSFGSLGVTRVEIINDFHAIAYALPRFDAGSRVEIGSASQYRRGNIAVLGPGSGLGMAAWIGGSAAMSGEGGHITLAARNSEEDRIIARLRDEYGHCSAERILSGPGLAALYKAMHGTPVDNPESITTNPDEPRNKATLDQFFLFLGNVAANLALITGAYGGVYIAGGIVPACIEQIKASGFRARFEDKNRYTDYMRAIPTWVITDPYPGLTGLGACIERLD
jgi:glucokinase